MTRLAWCFAMIMALGSMGVCQSNDSTPADEADQSDHAAPAQQQAGELNIKESNRVTLATPKDVRIKRVGDAIVLEWAPSSQKRVVEYKVFRVDQNDGKLVEIGRTTETAFPVGTRKSKAAFGVAAVDYRGNESPPSAPVSTGKRAATK